MIIEHMTDLIGDTPLLKIPRHVTGLKNVDLYAKLEMLNPFGSVKDRTAWAMVKDDLEEIKRTGQTIYENSSGNTAKSLQAIANIHGLKFSLISALAKVPEQKDVLQVMGAEIEEVATASDCFDPSDPNDPQYLIERKVNNNPDSVYFPSQFTNPKNPAYHEQTTAQEIIDDLGQVDYFFGGLGTTGSSLGICTRLRAQNPDFKAVGITAASNQYIPGIRNMEQMMESVLFQRDYYDQIDRMTESETLDGMMTLIRECSVLCGPTSGANFAAALRYLRAVDETLKGPRKAVFVVGDRMEWYISYIKSRRPEVFGEMVREHSLARYEDKPLSDELEMQPENLEAFRAAHPGAILIDMRAAQSFDLVQIPGSMNMPIDLFAKWIDGQNPFPRDSHVVLICAVGEKSRYYAGYLRTLGCTAYNLSGGIMAWRDAQRPLSRAA